MDPQEAATEARVQIENLLELAKVATSVDASDVLRLHLISEHSLCGIADDPWLVHGHEHDGPGTIRNHPREDRTVDLHKVMTVLQEGAELVPPYDAKIAELKAELERERSVNHHLREHLDTLEQSRLAEAQRADAAEARLNGTDVEIRRYKAIAEGASRRLETVQSAVKQIADVFEWTVDDD